MKKLLACALTFLFAGTITACGDSECDKLEKCCEAYSGQSDCTVSDDADDDQCKDARSAFASLLGTLGENVPADCKE